MLDSLKQQEQGHSTEVIFVLNNCTDRTEDIIKANGFNYILHCTEQGCGNARNVGLEHAQGEYVWFMDGDDWLLTPTAINEAIEFAQAKDIVRVRFQSLQFRREYFSMVWQYVIRRDFIGGIRFPNYQPCEDDAFMREALGKAGYNMWDYLGMDTLPTPQYYYNYLREGSNMYRTNILRERI